MFLFLAFIMNSSLLFTKADTCGTSNSFACKFINFSSTRQISFVTILHKRQKSPISSGVFAHGRSWF